MAAELTIKVVGAGSETLALSVEDLAQTSVRALKQLIERQDPLRFAAAAQRLIFQGQILQDDRLLTDYGVASGCAVHLTLSRGAAAPAAAPAAASAAASAAAPPAVATPGIEVQLRGFLQQMRMHETPAQYTAAVQTLQRICENIVNHPTEERYRKLRVGNAALRNKVFDRTRGTDCVKLLGFQEGVEEGHFVLVPSAERWEKLVAGKRVIDQAVQASAAAPAATPIIGAPAGGGLGAGFGGGFGGAPGAGGAPNWAAQAQAMLQNPAMAQMLASDPMVQQMAQSNPMMAQMLQNPAMLSQALQMMQQNPAMMQQVNQAMSDPNAMARMQQMMGSGGGFGGLGGLGGGYGGGFGGAPAAANPFAPASTPSNPFAPASTTSNPFAPTSSPSTPAPAPAPAPTSTPVPTPSQPSSTPASAPSAAASTSEDATFDEDEIAAAIARSLQDQ